MKRCVVEDVVSRYARKCWWADREDLMQEAETVRCEVEQRGCPGDAYLRTSVARHLATYLWGLSSPVSAPKDKRREKLKGLQRAPLDVEAPSPSISPEEAALLRIALEKVSRKMPDLWRLAEPVLLGERPAIVATQMCVARRSVYDAAARVRAALREEL